MRKSILSIGVATLALLVSFAIYANPLRRSSNTIEQSLLGEKPIGTPLREIETWLSKEKGLGFVVSPNGFDKQENPAYPKVVGVKSIRVELGAYWLLWSKTSVTAFFGFDSNSRLIEVWVWKTVETI